jgi:broad specificity phosphatase PhoE
VTLLHIIRHAESEANANPEIYFDMNDHDIPLTDKGYAQAQELPFNIRFIPGGYDVYVSPYLRTKLTWEIAAKGMATPRSVVESPLLREQEYEQFKTPERRDEVNAHRKEFGAFWYRYDRAESVADVYQRVHQFLLDLKIQKLNKTLPNNVVIVTHEVVVRMFDMILNNKSVADYQMHVPNCSITTYYL